MDKTNAKVGFWVLVANVGTALMAVACPVVLGAVGVAIVAASVVGEVISGKSDRGGDDDGSGYFMGG